MIKVSLAILVSLILTLGSNSQTSYDAPIDWSAYKIDGHNLSIMFPKLPIRFDQSYSCDEKRTENFIAYAEEVVYRLTVVKKERGNIHPGCRSVSRFGMGMLNDRRAELQKDLDKISTAEASEFWSSRAGKRSEKVWLLDELKKGRWIELAVTGRGDLPKAEEFMSSLDRSTGGDGISVGDGAEQTLGDRGVDTSVMIPSPTPASIANEAGSEPLAIIGKVKAQYTDAARSKNEQGAVTLRVTFLANGGIGKIEVTAGLKYGLTERAIAAAKKMAFLPQRVKGVAVSTTRPVSFSFNIY